MREIDGTNYYDEEEIKNAFAEANIDTMEYLLAKDKASATLSMLCMVIFSELADKFFRRLFNKTMKEVSDEDEQRRTTN